MICGLLAWYDEPCNWLSAAVTGAAKFCDHVVAVDGAYGLYPKGKAQSDPEQAEAILHAAYACGIGATIHRPQELWMGNQIEKRTAMFRIGASLDPDWFFVFDADDLVTRVPFDLKERLAETEHDVAVYTLWWGQDMEDEVTHAASRYHPGLFRNLPNLRVEDVHYHYLAEKDGQTVHLRGHRDVHDLAEFENLTDLKVQHRHPQRGRSRLEISAAYDRLVRAHGLEKVKPEDYAVA